MLPYVFQEFGAIFSACEVSGALFLYFLKMCFRKSYGAIYGADAIQCAYFCTFLMYFRSSVQDFLV